jgi:hypothetical protein
VQGGDGGGGEEVIRRRWLGFRLQQLEIQRQLVGEDGDGLLEDKSGGRSSGSSAGVGEEEAGALVVAPCSPTTNSSSSTRKRKRRRSWCRATRDRGRRRLVALWLYRAGGGGALHVQMVEVALWLFGAWSLVLGKGVEIVG